MRLLIELLACRLQVIHPDTVFTGRILSAVFNADDQPAVRITSLVAGLQTDQVFLCFFDAPLSSGPALRLQQAAIAAAAIL